MSRKTEKHIEADILRTYGDLANPNFEFVRKNLAQPRYQTVVENLSKVCRLRDETDPNNDVSFGYVLERDREKLFLQLSMIGPYFCLFRILDAGPILADGTTTESSLEKQTIDILESLNLSRVDVDLLKQPVALKLFNTSPERTCFYNALFSDTDVLPF